MNEMMTQGSNTPRGYEEMAQKTEEEEDDVKKRKYTDMFMNLMDGENRRSTQQKKIKTKKPIFVNNRKILMSESSQQKSPKQYSETELDFYAGSDDSDGDVVDRIEGQNQDDEDDEEDNFDQEADII